ncbi:MAG TPA: hypothetical protein PK454_07655 [Anaerolineaceae bacterium]|nr:hypothetical protein [Anaerolineaceae bacterium]
MERGHNPGFYPHPRVESATRPRRCIWGARRPANPTSTGLALRRRFYPLFHSLYYDYYF